MDTKTERYSSGEPNASHNITVRAHMPTMIKNEKIRQEVARAPSRAGENHKNSEIVYLIFQALSFINKDGAFFMVTI